MSKKNLINTIKKLKYFDQNFKINREKVDTIEKHEEKKLLRLQKEYEIVNKYITIHVYNSLTENTIVLKPEFKHKITQSKEDIVAFASINKKFPAMTLEEFELYDVIYKELNGK